jgi:ubiquitin carboxyl-terminal hydrolase L3
LARFVAAFQTQQPRDRARLLEDSEELESIYNEAAMQGDSLVPTDAQEEVDFHYVCFVKTEDCRIYELDGDRKGAIDKGVSLAAEDDMLSRASLRLVQDCIDREGGRNIGFSLMALVQTPPLL